MDRAPVDLWGRAVAELDYRKPGVSVVKRPVSSPDGLVVPIVRFTAGSGPVPGAFPQSEADCDQAYPAQARWNAESLRQLVQREIGDYRLVVVSNRQPYIHELVEGKLRYIVPAGGLTTALDPLMQECGGTWVAYGGGKGDWYAVDEQNKIAVPPTTPNIPCAWYGLRRSRSRVTTTASPMKRCGPCATTPTPSRCSTPTTGRPTRR